MKPVDPFADRRVARGGACSVLAMELALLLLLAASSNSNPCSLG